MKIAILGTRGIPASYSGFETAVEQLASRLTGTDLRDGSRVSLAALRGHYVVVNFFASWCIPCQEEAADLSRFSYQQAHAPHGADMISVVFHDTESSAKAFLQSNGDLWPAVTDPGGSIAERYGVTAPPTTFVVDPEGRVTAALEGPATEQNLDSTLKAAGAGGAGGAGGSDG